MTVRELYEHFLDNAPWVVRDQTPDLIEHGDPTAPIGRIGVGWSACTQNLEAATQDGCCLYITHEACFWDYWAPEKEIRNTPWGSKRLSILDESGMALMVLHDTWDVWPQYGIHDSWAALLGMGDPLQRVAKQDINLYAIEETRLDTFARLVASRVAPFGERWVIAHGDLATPVRLVALGTGCHLPTFEMLSLGADVLVHALDVSSQTGVRLPLLDLGANIIEVEHSVSEIPGMINLVRYLEMTYPALEVQFYRQESQSSIVAP